MRAVPEGPVAKKKRSATRDRVACVTAWCVVPNARWLLFSPFIKAAPTRRCTQSTPQNENGRRTPPDLANLARGSTCDNVAQRNPWADFRLRRKGGLEWEEFERNGTVPTGTVVVVKSNEVRETSAVTADQRRPLSPLMGPLAPSGIALVSW